MAVLMLLFILAVRFCHINMFLLTGPVVTVQ